MSKIDFKPPVGGTGVFSFVPPATNTDRTITLPDAGGQLHTSESVNDHASMPTVAGDPIVASGSNSDGDWTRFADGTQHIYRICSTSGVNQDTFSYPVPFLTGSEAKIAFGSIIISSSTTSFTQKLDNVAATTFDYGVVSGGGSWISSSGTKVHAIGRWK